MHTIKNQWRGAILPALALGLGLALTTPSVDAQTTAPRNVALEIRGGLNVPTFDIADAADAGPSGGVGIYYRLADRVWLIGDADFGFHSGASLPGGGSGPDVNVYHYIAKLGYQVTNNPDSRWTVVLNAGAGAMTFNVDNGPSFTYPAINVGAKILYAIGANTSFVLSPQGDIAFTKRDELGTTNAWVWPFAVGLRFGF